MDNLEFLGFKRSCDRLRYLAKYQNKIGQIPILILQEELDIFL